MPFGAPASSADRRARRGSVRAALPDALCWNRVVYPSAPVVSCLRRRMRKMANDTSTAEQRGEPRIRFSEEAAAKLREVVDGYPRPVAGLRLQIVGRTGGEFQHVLSLVEQ